MTRLRGTLMAAAVPLLLLSACAQTTGNPAAGAPGSGSPESSAAGNPRADELVLRAESTGGFVPVERVVGALPMVSVYGDGRVITEGPVPAIFPGPALPNVQVSMITPELVQQLVKQAVDAGVKPGADFGQPNVADAPATRVTVVTGAGPQTVTAAALNEAQANDPRLTAEQRTARTKLAAFVKMLSSLPAAEGVPHSVAYDPTELAALTKPWTEPANLPGNTVQSPPKAWPGPALPGEVLNTNTGIGCTVVTGTQKDQVLAAAKTATSITPWTQGGKKWSITFRPLLPEETGCATLKGDK
jgi:hypothetical protein